MQNLAPRDGEIYLIPGYFSKTNADRLLNVLLNELDWQEEEIIIFGKKSKVPRLTCWYGDSDAVYRYSGVDHNPIPWASELLTIKKDLEQFSGYSFNSVLANLYRNGLDSMGWHADKEKELGQNPAIASASFGQSRLFRIRHNKTGETLDIQLRHGDLLLMANLTQHHWRHCLPKSRKAVKSRVNLTFRNIISL